MKQICISLSGGRTSATMTKLLLNHFKASSQVLCFRSKGKPEFGKHYGIDPVTGEEVEITIVFANTGKENEATLKFIEKCSSYFGFYCNWIEAVTHQKKGQGVTAKRVWFRNASRKGEPFIASILKHGLPNQNAPRCTRELKGCAIRAFMRAIGWKKYWTAIGIRIDEIDRMDSKRVQKRYLYPLISLVPTKKQDVNMFWSKMPFDLELKDYEGNCDCCWKKSLRKLLTIAKETPEKFGWWLDLEKRFEEYIPEKSLSNKNIKPPLRMYRNSMSVKEILEMANKPFIKAIDQSKNIEGQTGVFDNYELDVSNGCEDSCEAF